MKLQNEVLWNRLRRRAFVNNDAEGLRRMAFARAWCDQMEEELDRGLPLRPSSFAEVYARDEHKDTTGDLAEVVALIGVCWVYGAELRYLHNAALGWYSENERVVAKSGLVFLPPESKMTNQETIERCFARPRIRFKEAMKYVRV